MSVKVQKEMQAKMQGLWAYVLNCAPNQHAALLSRCRSFGVPCSGKHSREKLAVQVGASVLALLLQDHGVVLATIFLNDLCGSTNYWHTLHLLAELAAWLQQAPLPSSSAFNLAPLQNFKNQPPNIQNKYSCICQCDPHSTQHKHEQSEACPKCLCMYHPSCQAQPLVCNRCNLLEESLDYRSISQLYCGYFSNQYHTHTVEFGTPEVEEARMSHHCTYIVEARIRPVRVGKGKLHRQFGLYLNKQIVKLKCGQLNVRLPVRILSSVNSLIIHTKHYPAHVPQQYAIGIYKVVPKAHKKEHIYSKLTRLPQPTIRRFYQHLNLTRLCPLQYSYINLLSKATGKRITLPVRSYRCRHFEVFDYFELMEQPTHKCRVCPICEQPVLGVYVDYEVEALLSLSKTRPDAKELMIEFDVESNVLSLEILDGAL